MINSAPGNAGPRHAGHAEKSLPNFPQRGDDEFLLLTFESLVRALPSRKLRALYLFSYLIQAASSRILVGGERGGGGSKHSETFALLGS
jgi:hypothetical protein